MRQADVARASATTPATTKEVAKHILKTKAAALALDAYANDDTNALLAHLDSMERASMRVLDNLQKMGEAATADPSLLCQPGEGHRH